jgi:hypothetical protein
MIFFLIPLILSQTIPLEVKVLILTGVVVIYVVEIAKVVMLWQKHN